MQEPSFADAFFDTGDSLSSEICMSINDETVRPYRDGDGVFVEQGGTKYRVVSRSGSSFRSVCEIREVHQ